MLCVSYDFDLKMKAYIWAFSSYFNHALEFAWNLCVKDTICPLDKSNRFTTPSPKKERDAEGRAFVILLSQIIATGIIYVHKFIHYISAHLPFSSYLHAYQIHYTFDRIRYSLNFTVRFIWGRFGDDRPTSQSDIGVLISAKKNSRINSPVNLRSLLILPLEVAIFV